MEADGFVLCESLVKIYKVADLEVVALQGLDLEVEKGEMMALIGPSGAGKSTLLNVIGGLDTPSAGVVQIAGWDLLKMKPADRVRYKKEVVGFAWQQPARNLLPYLNARENVELPMQLAGMSSGKRHRRAGELLEVVEMKDTMRHRPDQLSGGQQQRVALAVALANNPPLLLGDELTGQIDTQSSQQVFDALKRINQAYHTTIILVTHDALVSGLVNRVVAIRDGKTSTEIRRRHDHVSGEVHEEEWVLLDQAGRLQLPKPYVEKLNLRGRAKVRLEETHVTVWPQNKVSEFIRLQTPEIVAPSKPLVQQEKRYPVVATKEVWRTFDLGVEKVHAVQDVSLAIPMGKLVVFKGRSGSGKTTLLNLVAGLDEPTHGQIAVGGKLLAKMSAAQRVMLRRRHIGFVFQTFGLLPFLSVEENVGVPMRLLRAPVKQRRQRVAQMLEIVGLAEAPRIVRVAASRHRPRLINRRTDLADDPGCWTTTGAALFNCRDIVDRR
jgi:peptide/nickel transport system ATP-binding protein